MNCKACAGEWPRKDHWIADLDLSQAYLHDDQFFPGWTVLVLKRHAIELFDLTKDERSRLIEEVSEVALALDMALDPVNIHWHVIPRLSDDPAPRDAVWTVRHEPKRLPADELRNLASRIRVQLRE